MQEFKKDNDYSVIVFGENGFIAKYEYVDNLYNLSKYLDERFHWRYMNVYARRSKRYLVRYYRGSYIVPRPVL